MKDLHMFKKIAPIIEKTIGYDLSPGVKAMTKEESYEWHKKHARIDQDSGNLIISDEEIGDGSYEKHYMKP